MFPASKVNLRASKVSESYSLVSMADSADPVVPDNLLEEHGDYLFRFAMSRLRNRDLAEELVQETLVKAIKHFKRFRGDSSLRTWLIQILRNEISGFFRKQQTKSRHFAEIDEAKVPDLSALLDPKISNHEFRSEIEKSEFWVTVQECFSKLPDHLLETFLSKWHNDDKKTEDICKEMGISSSNFSVRMFRARVMLRKCLETAWFETSQS